MSQTEHLISTEAARINLRKSPVDSIIVIEYSFRLDKVCSHIKYQIDNAELVEKQLLLQKKNGEHS